MQFTAPSTVHIVVALITEGTAYDRRGRPFKRRNYLPGIAVGVVLLAVTALVWLVALNRPADVRSVAVCNPPPPAADGNTPTLGEKFSRTMMSDITPANLADTKIRVLNASGRGGQAAETAGALRDLGFAQPTAENDPVYADARLQCQGQIRFGPSGQAAAAAVWLVAPCVELLQDGRSDDSVDLALGTDFSALTHSDQIDSVLAGLRPGATGAPDQATVKQIHTDAC